MVANADRTVEEAQGALFAGHPPSFAPPGARAARIGVLDVGSNSVRFVVFEGHSRSPAVIFNEKVLCGLGRSLAETGRLDDKGKARCLAALSRFAALAPRLRVGALAGVATAAVREAADGAAFCQQIYAETGIRLRIASGAEEARLAAKGVLFGDPNAAGVVVDLGGASLEVCPVGGGKAGVGRTAPLGPQRLRALAETGDLGAAIRECLAPLATEHARPGAPLYLVGGAWRALARVQMARTDYPLRVLHEYAITPEDAADLGTWAAEQKPEHLHDLGASSSRAQAMALTGPLLAELVRAFAPGKLVLSAFGLREGICLDNIRGTLRHLDPLLAACSEQERLRARAPGFGAEVGTWALRLLGVDDPARVRLARAVGHLCDVNWRVHPDYRSASCWETVTRPTITALGHEGRAFLGAALMARYKDRKIERNPIANLLGGEALAEARALGLALRLGSALAGSAPGALAGCRVERAGTHLSLTVTGPAQALVGEEVEKRLTALGKALGCRTALQAAA
ncbi:MAG: exopolyphosphatase [Pseudomonadota bacterium]